MLTQTYRENRVSAPVLAYCPRCKDRCRFEGGANEIVCTCTVARWKFASNDVRIEGIRGRVTHHKCGAKCLHAKGGDCDCSCGGANHGKGHGA